MKESIWQIVQKYNICQLNKSETVATPSLLQPIPISKGPWSIITIDFICGLPKSQGKDIILVVIDKFTKYYHLIALAHPFKVMNVAQQFLDGVYKLHGFPSKIITDQDPLFISNFWRKLMKRVEVELISVLHITPK
jgi:hypothetical protein